MNDETAEFRLAQAISQAPHARALGLQLVGAGAARAEAVLPYRPDLVGDPDTRILAGGAITALLDQICGVAVMTALPRPAAIATLDLRIDYMRPAPPGRDVRAEAHCFKVTRSVAFVRAVAFIDDPGDPVATANAAFILPAESAAS